IVQHSNDAIYTNTLDGTIASWNPSAERMFGYTAEEITGQNIALLVPPERRDELAAAMQRLRSGEPIAPFETVRRRKNGEPIDLYITVSPVKGRTGAIKLASVIARDISERKRVEEHLREAQKLEDLGLIAEGVAHDFNTLLTG